METTVSAPPVGESKWERERRMSWGKMSENLLSRDCGDTFWGEREIEARRSLVAEGLG
jgi:hypothetical protein